MDVLLIGNDIQELVRLSKLLSDSHPMLDITLARLDVAEKRLQEREAEFRQGTKKLFGLVIIPAIAEDNFTREFVVRSLRAKGALHEDTPIFLSVRGGVAAEGRKDADKPTQAIVNELTGTYAFVTCGLTDGGDAEAIQRAVERAEKVEVARAEQHETPTRAAGLAHS